MFGSRRFARRIAIVTALAFCTGAFVQTLVRSKASSVLIPASDAVAAVSAGQSSPPLQPDLALSSTQEPRPAVSQSLAIVLASDAAAAPDNAADARIAALQAQLRSTGPEPLPLEQLGWAFVEKARASGDDGYYQFARHCARAIRELGPDGTAKPDGTAQPGVTAKPDGTVQPDVTAKPDGEAQPDVTAKHDGSPEADLLEGHALLALHRFQEAELVAARLVARRGSPLDYALHGDTLLDQGRISDAVAAYERMMAGRPDSRAYSRVAEVRLLTGDLAGARDAMHTAARAVSPRDRSSFAWIWARLAMLDLQRGELEQARNAAQVAVAADPGSPIAQFAYGRVLLAAGDAAGAIAPLKRSAAASPLVETLRALADAYEATNRDVDAARTLAELEIGSSLHDPRGVSVWLAETGSNPSRALSMAETELERRRDVYTFDALAVASAAAGRVDEARRHMREALSAGTEDPRLWYHAGIVAAAADAPGEARDWFLKARSGEQMLLPSQRRDLARRLEHAQAALATKPGSRNPA